MLAPLPRPTAPGNGNELRPWKAHPVAVTATLHATASSRRVDRALIMTVVTPPRAVVCRALAPRQEATCLPRSSAQRAPARPDTKPARERQANGWGPEGPALPRAAAQAPGDSAPYTPIPTAVFRAARAAARHRRAPGS